MTVLAVFKSRSETLGYISLLRGAGVVASAVSTPQEAGVGCGISARFEAGFLPRAKAVLARGHYRSFAGFLQKTNFGYTFI